MATLNDLMYAFFGGTPSLNDAALAFYQAANAAGVTGTAVISGAYTGSGSPEGVVTANVGSMYRRTSNGHVYMKQSGTGNTGWVDISSGGGGGSAVDVEEEGVTVVTGATAINFIGSLFAATDAGAGVAAVTGIDPDASTIEVGGGVLRVKDLGIVAGKIAADAVTTAKILDKNVTLAKIADLTQARILGRASGAGSGVTTELTAAQVATILTGQFVLTTSQRCIRAVIDGGGSAITTGAKKVYISVPYACTIKKARLLADQSGSIVVDIWKDTYANFPPTVADTITASAKPTLSSAQKSEDSTLTGWTTAIAAGDVLEVNVDSATTVTKVYLDLFVDLA